MFAGNSFGVSLTGEAVPVILVLQTTYLDSTAGLVTTFGSVLYGQLNINSLPTIIQDVPGTILVFGMPVYGQLMSSSLHTVQEISGISSVLATVLISNYNEVSGKARIKDAVLVFHRNCYIMGMARIGKH